MILPPANPHSSKVLSKHVDKVRAGNLLIKSNGFLVFSESASHATANRTLTGSDLLYFREIVFPLPNRIEILMAEVSLSIKKVFRIG